MSKQIRYLPGAWLELKAITLVWMVGVAIAAALFLSVRGYYQTVERQRFQRDAVYYSTLVTETLDRQVNSLKSLRAFVAARDVTRWEFSAFADQTLPTSHGFKAVLWVPVISDAARKTYEQKFQRDGLYGLRIREMNAAREYSVAAARPAYFPVTFVDPLEGNQDLIGLDLATDPDYRDLLQLAGRTDGLAVSPLKRSGSGKQTGSSLLVAFPLRASADTAASGKERPGLKGFAIGILDVDELVKSVLPRTAPVEIEIHQAEPNASAAPAYAWLAQSAFFQSQAFDIANRHFALYVRSSGESEATTGIMVALAAGLGVLLLTGLLAQHLHNATIHHQAVERAVVARTAELNTANAALRDEIAMRREAEASLRRAKEKTEAADRAKSQFLARMSHKLRAPLNTIIGLSDEMVREVEAGNGAVRIRGYVEDVNTSGLTLLQLVNELLDLSQLDSKLMPLDDAPVSVADVIRTASGKLKAQAKSAGVSLTTHCPDDRLFIRTDERLLTKALVNLLSNAIQFTPAGGEAELFARQNRDGSISLVTRDTGIGIPSDKIEQVLEPFVRLPSSLPREHDGAGLGLSFVNRVAQVFRFDLSIESEKGAGTRVTLTCPRERVIDKTQAA